MLFVQVSVSSNEDREHVYRLHHHLCLQCHAPGLVAVTKFKTTKITTRHTVFGTYGGSLHPLGGARSPGTLQPHCGLSKTPLWVALILPCIFPSGSLSSHGHYSNMDSALTPLSPTQATHFGLPIHEKYPMAHNLSPTIHPSLWQLIPLS